MLTPLAVSYANSNIPVSTLGSCADLRESFDDAGSSLTSGDFGEISPDWEMSQKKTRKSVCLLTLCFVLFIPLCNICCLSDNICFRFQRLCSDKVVPCEVD